MSGALPHTKSGVRKAAILLVLLGEETASLIFRNLSESELQHVTQEIGELGPVEPDEALAILNEYHQLAMTQEYIAQGGMEYAERLLIKTLGPEGARAMLEAVSRAQELSASKLDSLQKADPQQLAKFLQGEHPQTIALILAHLDSRQASALLMKLTEETRAAAVKTAGRTATVLAGDGAEGQRGAA